MDKSKLFERLIDNAITNAENKNPYFKKYLRWNGKCGSYAKHNGYDEKLKRMNKIRDEYLKMSNAKIIVCE